MTIRCCIPTPQIPTFSIFKAIQPFEQTDMTLFAPWACQANHLIHDLPINIMDLQTATSTGRKMKRDSIESPMLNNLLETGHLYLFCPLKGQYVIEDSLIQAAFGITFYEILRMIHEACGFDPYSTEVAEYLGLPLAVIDVGHSGLAGCMEDPEYTSEAESGDSDYVSASEDA
ncbi:hypothetical protein C8J56DRAFT_1050976 [Mycena floridula]|nr:hypothetical protein C8J56DRAFT_1050976 [Mycena floridula]